MTGFNPQTTQQLGLAIIVTAVLALVTLALLYAGLPFFGPVNDLLTAVGGLLFIGLVWQFHGVLWQKAPIPGTLLLVAGWLGGLLIVGNAVLVAFGKLRWQTGGMYTALGYGLLGVWLLGMLLIVSGDPFLPSGLTRLGLATGVCLLFGFLAGPLMAGQLTIEAGLLSWGIYILAGAGFVLFQLWCWRLAASLK